MKWGLKMSGKNLINYLEARERNYRKYIGLAKKEGDEIRAEYFKGHVHEIENLLFILNKEGC